MRLSRIAWSLRQLLPLPYHTVYRTGDQWHYCRWRMWFGRAFAVRDRQLN